jgi:hypothetical protein
MQAVTLPEKGLMVRNRTQHHDRSSYAFMDDPRLATTIVLRCPFKVSFARRFLTSSSAWRWVENEPKRSSPMRTDQPSLVGSTTKIVVIASVATKRA